MAQGHAEQAPAQQGGCEGGKCSIPMNVDINQYMEEQRQQQQFQAQQTAAEIKAKFDAVMAEVTMKKHRYALSVMTEFTTMCSCLQDSVQIYQSMFVETARATNMTDIIDLEEEARKLPYQATSLKEAKERIFGGMLNALCQSLGQYMQFAQNVETRIGELQAAAAQGK